VEWHIADKGTIFYAVYEDKEVKEVKEGRKLGSFRYLCTKLRTKN
jgi:hypothetical protein